MLLDTAELNACGAAQVVSIEPCPAIASGAGRVVIGTFRHDSSSIVDLRIEGLAEPIGTTSDHPFWSRDRASFVAAGELHSGEALLSAEGESLIVESVTPRPGTSPVHNLEIQGLHTYTVSNFGVVVHNNGAYGGGIPDNGWSFRKQLRRDVYLAKRPEGIHRTKHVNASTIAEARDMSLGIGTYRGRAEASYLPQLASEVVSLEKSAAFKAIRVGHVFEHGGTRFLFHKADYDLGFNNGSLTKWMRIELTRSGKPIIHSFPVDLASVRRYVPGAE